jgi:hypothetical protein
MSQGQYQAGQGVGQHIMDLPGQPSALGQCHRFGTCALSAPQFSDENLSLPLCGAGPLFREPGGAHERENKHQADVLGDQPGHRSVGHQNVGYVDGAEDDHCATGRGPRPQRSQRSLLNCLRMPRCRQDHAEPGHHEHDGSGSHGDAPSGPAHIQ